MSGLCPWIRRTTQFNFSPEYSRFQQEFKRLLINVFFTFFILSINTICTGTGKKEKEQSWPCFFGICLFSASHGRLQRDSVMVIQVL